MNDGSNTATTAPNPPTYTRFSLTPKQQEFFRRAAVMRQQIDVQMQGALQLIILENELRGKVTLADDYTELIVEIGGG